MSPDIGQAAIEVEPSGCAAWRGSRGKPPIVRAMTAATSTLPRLLTSREAAALLGVTLWTIRDWVAAGKLRAVRVGRHGRLRFRREDLDRLIGDGSDAER